MYIYYVCLTVCNVLSSCEWTQARIYEPVTRKGERLSKEKDIRMNEREKKRRKREEKSECYRKKEEEGRKEEGDQKEEKRRRSR